MTKLLRGVNELLNAIGEPPLLDEADYSLSYEAGLANTQIDNTLEDVLSEGFKFNSYTVDLHPDINGYIAVPPTALVMEFESEDLTVNNGMVFDRELFTSKFEDSITVTVVYSVPFDSCPPVIQNYVIAEAKYIFQIDRINDESISQRLDLKRRSTQTKLNVWKIKQAKANGKDGRFSRNANPTN